MQKVLLSLVESKKTIIITSHIQSHIVDICEQVLVIQNANEHHLLPKKEFEFYLNKMDIYITDKVNNSKI
jgi:ABC-type multidrug transport system ATPase subunit